MLTYDALIERLTQWALAEPDVRAALVIGSRARTDHPADEWSDLDILVFANNPDLFIKSAKWATSLAPCWLTFVERTGDGKTWERRSLYEGGLDVDVAFNPMEYLDGMLARGIPPDYADVIRRGVKILADKDGKLVQILSMPLPEVTLFQKPTAQEFTNASGNFWYHTLWSAKHLRRGELWWAKSGVDMHLKELLQQMLEWHAHAMNGNTFDTWLRGRFLEEWADPRAIKELHGVFAHYDAGDVAMALRATMDLYRWLEEETAARWEYTCPVEGECQTADRTIQLLDEVSR